MSNFTSKLVLLGGLVGVGFAGATLAAPSDANTLVVHYDAASLSTEDGLQGLYRELTLAADQVCPIEPSNSHMASEEVLSCRRQALQSAVSSIHSKRLAALFAASAKAG